MQLIRLKKEENNTKTKVIKLKSEHMNQIIKYKSQINLFIYLVVYRLLSNLKIYILYAF